MMVYRLVRLFVPGVNPHSAEVCGERVSQRSSAGALR